MKEQSDAADSATQAKYSAAVETWRFFAAWREKIIAGYLAVLAGLAAGFTHYQNPGLRCAMLGGAIVASVVFWIFDVRNVYLLNVAQAAADRLEGDRSKGCFAALETRLDPGKTRLWVSTLMPTYAQAINLLVASVIGCSIAALYTLLVRLHREGKLIDSGVPAATAIAAALVTVLVLGASALRTQAWLGEKQRREEAQQKARQAVEQPDAADERRGITDAARS